MMEKKVKFVLAAEIAAGASKGLLLGEFNNWEREKGVELKKSKDGSLQATVALEGGKTYEYRYLLEDGRWVNDGNADSYRYVHFVSTDNCVINVPETTPKKTAVAKPKKATSKDEATTTQKDDLTKIEGIGKKIAALLAKNGISSFSALSKTTAKKIKEVLDSEGDAFKLSDPKSWPKQAKLAAAGKWDELKSLQDELHGGK